MDRKKYAERYFLALQEHQADQPSSRLIFPAYRLRATAITIINLVKELTTAKQTTLLKKSLNSILKVLNFL